DAGRHDEARILCRERRLLVQAAPGLVHTEPWFAAEGPLVSVVILCCGEAEVTDLCLRSLARHTRPPYEVVLVDNGSKDSTPKLLEEFKQAPGPDRVAVLTNASNRGFSAGCNQGLAEARGEVVVFLNNDTVLTEGWLGDLLGCLERHP